jgi:hypothetical protein
MVYDGSKGVDQKMSGIQIEYKLTLSDGKLLRFPLQFSEPGFDLVLPSRENWPSWALLDNHKCNHCPLESTTCSHCPLASSLVDIVEATGDVVSHTPVQVEVDLPARKISLKSNVGDTLRSLLRLVIPTSGCPHAAFFKPMARFHLPLSDQEETLFRACSMHLLAQHFRGRAGLQAEQGFGGLVQIYADLNTVNQQVAARLQEAAGQDSSRSAVALLDIFAQIIPFTFDQALESLGPLFAAYLATGGSG